MVGPAIDERSGPGPNPAIGRSASSVPERERRPEIKTLDKDIEQHAFTA